MGSDNKYPVTLTMEDREALKRLTRTGVQKASIVRRARVLLALDSSAGGVDSRAAIAARVGVSVETIRLVSMRFVETGGDIWATDIALDIMDNENWNGIFLTLPVRTNLAASQLPATSYQTSSTQRYRRVKLSTARLRCSQVRRGKSIVEPR